MPERLLQIDRIAVHSRQPEADRGSFIAQNLSGAIAVAVPLLWHGIRFTTGALSPPVAAAFIATDLAILAETTALNGMVTELARVATQRPRPFVYAAPRGEGANPAHYVSFYSGHTSFSAAAGLALLLLLVSRGAPRWLSWLAGTTSLGLLVATATLRVAAGLHFPTDVLAGALAGLAIALGVALLNRKPFPENS